MLKMRICLVSHSARDGGAERVLLETIALLRRHGIDCKVLLPSRGYLATELTRQGVEFCVISYPLWMGRGKANVVLQIKTAVNLIKDTLQVAWTIRRWKCSLVYSNTVTVSVGAFAALLLRLPHIWHLHEFGFQDQGLRFLFGERWSLRLVNRLSAGCICVSGALAKAYEGSIKPAKLSVIYPSVHQAIQESLQDDCASIVPHTGRFRCLIVGALIEGKGQEDGVLALALLRKAGVDAELLLVGDGEISYRRHLEKLVESHGLEGIVIFAGAVKSALPEMQAADVVLICSRSEAFGRVTIEAMLMGKPIIGARSGATVELIESGVTGLLYSVCDPEDLAAHIRYLHEHPDIAFRLGMDARRWVERQFSQNRSNEKMMAVLTSLCDASVS